MAGPVIWSGADGKLIASGTLKDKRNIPYLQQPEKNYISMSGWGDSGGGLTVVETTTASELPREFTSPTGLKIAADDGIGVGDHVYYDFTLDDIDQNRKLNIKWAQKLLSTYAAGDLIVYIADQSSRAIPLHTPLVSSIPGYDLDFDANGFDTATTATLSLVIKNVSLSSGEGIVISDVIVGPGTIQAVPAVGNYEVGSITGIIGSNVTAPTLTGASSSLYTKRDQNLLFMRITAVFTNANAGSGTYRILLPNGLTLDTNLLTSFQYVGSGVLYGTSSTQEYPLAVHYHSSGFLQMYINDTSDWQTFTNTTPSTTSDRSFYLELAVPIAEWAGAPNYAGQNDVEYASVGGTWDAASSTTVYGPAGSAMGGALTSARVKTITWQTPIQSTDRIELWFSRDRITWTPAENSGIGSPTVYVVKTLSSGGSFISGATTLNVPGNTSQTNVVFAQYAAAANDDSPTNNWPSSQGYWVVTKAKAGAAVGFGLADTSGRAGLVNPYTEGSGVVYSGTYTPTLSNLVNCSAATVRQNNYSRNGKIVTVTGRVDLTVTATATATSFNLTLPVTTSNFGDAYQASGSGVLLRAASVAQDPAVVVSVASSATAQVYVGRSNAPSGTSAQMYYSFSYEIQ